MNSETSTNPPSGTLTGAAFDHLQEWDPTFAGLLGRMTSSPWSSGILPLKTVELVALAFNAACTNLNAEGVRQHIRGALDAGATREEILMVLKMASLLSIHTCSLAAPILLEEAQAAGVRPSSKPVGETPVCDKMKAAGQWNTAWEPFFQLDPAWTEAFIAAGAPVYIGGVLPPKLAELLSIAFDASITHMYAPGTRRHIRNALKAGASLEEIMDVLKICVAEGAQAMNVGAPLLAAELAHS